MKLLVTGGLGFIGSNFVNYINKHRKNFEVVVIDSYTYAANESNILLKTNKLIRGSIVDYELLDSVIKDSNIVVNFAAESHNDNSLNNPKPFIETNIVGTYNILEAVRKYKKRLHHISTDEVYGDLPYDSDEKFTLQTPYNPSSPYSASKASSDLLVRAWIRSFGISATISNCSNNYGPYQHVEKFIPRQITNIIEGLKPKIYGEGKNVRDWLHVEDHCSAILKIIENGKIGDTYLIGANCEKSNIEVIKMILKKMGRSDDWIDYIEDRKGHDRRYAIDNSKIVNELDWVPTFTDFEDGIVNTISWYVSNTNWWRETKITTENKYKKF